ncbi:unnamed protein product [Notodromas monacha]|uniref:Uncharacterized protein n=1 Tax=Notodromas monacha TaxID=399045 RepID=A0A7R9C3Q9_9CRUS|nr:unnamed protein product [Notodromas monacha]CAG0925646.1 unnamed protein product [Notodromas monacha]
MVQEAVTKKDQSMVMLFFGIFFATFQSAGIWGNLITSTVLSRGEEVKNDTNISACGVNYCEASLGDIENLKRPEEWRVRIMLSIFAGVSIFAALPIIIFLDPLERFDYDGEDTSSTKKKTNACSLALSSLKQMTDPRQALLSVLIFYSGIYQGFFDADFTKANIY